MKFSCDSCNAQYMIADEKVGARGVKVKCKKCAHVIIVKPLVSDAPAQAESAPIAPAAAAAPGADPNAGASAAEQDGGEMGGAFDSMFGGGAAGGASADDGWGSFGAGDTAAAAAASTQAQVSAGDKEWYVAIDEAQVGPVDIAEIEQRWDARELNEDSLAWKAGMSDWSPLAEIPELAYLVTERPQSAPKAASQLASGASALAADHAGGGGGVAAPLAPMSFGGAAGAESAAPVDWKPSAASALSSLVQEELEAPAEQSKPVESRPDGVPELGMPGFGAGDLFGGGGGNGSAVGGAGGGAFATQAPAMEPLGGAGPDWSVPETRSRRSNGGGEGGLRPWHLFAGVGGLAVVGLLAVVILRMPGMGTPTPTAPSAPAAPAAQPAAPPVTKPTTPAPAASPSPPPAQAKPAATPAPPQPETSRRTTRRNRPKPSKPKPKPKPDPKPPAKASLSKSDILGVVKGNASKVAPCLKNAKSRNEIVPGKYKFIIDWTINDNGTVSNARLKGPASVMSTSLPRCFAQVIGRWRFPSSRKSTPISNFPFGPITVR